VASIPIVFPLTKPAVLRHCSTHVKTARCASKSISRRVPRNRRVIRRRGVQADTEEVAQGERIRRATHDAGFRVDALEVANQEQPEIDPGGKPGRPIVSA
jgi:hypothetical protein